MTLITGKFVEFPRLVARNLNMYQAPNLNGDCQAIYSQTLGKKHRRDTCLFFSEYQIEGWKIWHVTNASIQEIFFYLDIREVNLLDVGRWAPGN